MRLRPDTTNRPSGDAAARPSLFQIPPPPAPANRPASGAGEGNRTLIASLEGWSSTIELHPRIHLSFGPDPTRQSTGRSHDPCDTLLTRSPVIGGGGRIRTYVDVRRQI